MPSDRSANRWGNAALVGTAVAAGGAGMVLQGASSEGDAKRLVRTRTDDAANAKRGIEAAQEKLQRYQSGLKVDRAMAGGKPPTAAQRAAEEKPYRQAIGHQKARLSGHEKEIGRQQVRQMGARRVKRIGSGVLGAGATLGALGAVMAERRRKQGPKVSAPKAPASREPKDIPLKDYRSMVSTGGLLQDEQGKPKGISPSAGRDWLRANKDRA